MPLTDAGGREPGADRPDGSVAGEGVLPVPVRPCDVEVVGDGVVLARVLPGDGVPVEPLPPEPDVGDEVGDDVTVRLGDPGPGDRVAGEDGPPEEGPGEDGGADVAGVPDDGSSGVAHSDEEDEPAGVAPAHPRAVPVRAAAEPAGPGVPCAVRLPWPEGAVVLPEPDGVVGVPVVGVLVGFPVVGVLVGVPVGFPVVGVPVAGVPWAGARVPLAPGPGVCLVPAGRVVARPADDGLPVPGAVPAPDDGKGQGTVLPWPWPDWPCPAPSGSWGPPGPWAPAWWPACWPAPPAG